MGDVDFTRVVVHLVSGELARLRRTGTLTGPLAEMTPATELGESALGIDSLELLHLASAVNEQFHLHETAVGDYLLRHRTIGDWAEVVRASWAVAHDRITFRTSGTTGSPKPCTHRCTDLWEEVAGHAAYFGPVRRIVSFVPSHHIYGFLFTAIMPAMLGVSVVDGRQWSAAKFHRDLGAGDLLVAMPSYWDYLSRSLQSFGADVQGVTSTAPCPPTLFARLQEQRVALTEIYGSSETAGVARRSQSDGAFTLLPGWRREGETVRRVSREPSMDETTSGSALPDRLIWTGEREFRLGGRVDGAVQVGGMNVFPEQIAARIAEHPAVNACAVRLMQPHEGDRLKAYVVWRDATTETRSRPELETWVRTELTPAERPMTITSGMALPRNELGKLRNWDVCPR